MNAGILISKLNLNSKGSKALLKREYILKKKNWKIIYNIVRNFLNLFGQMWCSTGCVGNRADR